MKRLFTFVVVIIIIAAFVIATNGSDCTGNGISSACDSNGATMVFNLISGK